MTLSAAMYVQRHIVSLCNNSCANRFFTIRCQSRRSSQLGDSMSYTYPTRRATLATPTRQKTVWKWSPLVLGFCLLQGVAVRASEALTGNGLEPQGPTSPSGGPVILTPFKYIPPPGPSKKPANESAPKKRTPEQQRVIELNAAGNYQAIANEGIPKGTGDKPDDELQLIFANSLAWTGNLRAAVAAYKVLASGVYANEALVGTANVERWSGREDLALPMYEKVLQRDPGNADAREGAELASRELSPRTSLSLGSANDSSNMQRQSAAIKHRWRGADGSTIMEVETGTVDDALPARKINQQDITLRYQDLGLALKPSIELSVPNGNGQSLYASAKIQFDEDRETVEVGRVNWGKLVTNANALAANLSASHIGLSAVRNFALGSVLGRIDYYDISDNNSILSSRLQFNSAWRPLGSHVKPFASIESRQAKFNTLNYWSPDHGSTSLYAGLLAEWGVAEWNIYSSAQYGVGLSGEAGNGWSVTGGGKRWVSNDMALSMNLWSMSTWRDNANYRAQSATVTLEKLWR